MNPKKFFHRLAWLAVMCAMPMLPGCMMTLSAVNSMDMAQKHRQAVATRKKQVEIVKNLQAQGDPMGDYLYALANAEGWWPENPITDPLVIKSLYEKAAAKGSSDAMIVLGLMLIMGVAAPQEPEVPPIDERDPKRGVELIEKGMAIRCFYIQPDPLPGPGESCFAERSPAGWVGVMFRDGRSFMGVEKDQTKADEWFKRHDACKAYVKSHPPIMRCNF